MVSSKECVTIHFRASIITKLMYKKKNEKKKKKRKKQKKEKKKKKYVGAAYVLSGKKLLKN